MQIAKNKTKEKKKKKKRLLLHSCSFFLNELFQGKTIQSPAMKYGLINKIRLQKSILIVDKKKTGLVGNPAFCRLVLFVTLQ